MKIRVKYIAAYILAILLLCCSVQATSSFLDVDENTEYAEAVEYVNDAGIMGGIGNGYFSPNTTVTRAQMAAIICRFLGETDNLVTSNRFSDVSKDYWANGYIDKVAGFGIINGYGDGSFRPDGNVTCQQAVAMIIRAIGAEDEANELGGYPQGYFAVANEADLLVDIHSEADEPLSRADIAMILYRYYCVSAIQ